MVDLFSESTGRENFCCCGGWFVDGVGCSMFMIVFLGLAMGVLICVEVMCKKF